MDRGSHSPLRLTQAAGSYQLDGHMHYYDSTGRRRLKRRYVWGGYGFVFGVIIGLTLAAGIG
ncbi:MAG: hypothetical protein ABF271_15570 [Abyssibacter sp.]|uniref:hypothetical protein n=1 Tax=Abyssibacter sp. TaxID=2320200 RepID=UPI002E98ECD1|nr:hypothetical protein [Pseudomonadota bacterium]